jgi:hypothetical protein
VDRGESTASIPFDPAPAGGAVGACAPPDEGFGSVGLPGSDPRSVDASLGGACVVTGAGWGSVGATATVELPDPLGCAAEIDPVDGLAADGAARVAEVPVAAPDAGAGAFAPGPFAAARVGD